LDWPQHIFDSFKAFDVRQVCHVPDAGHTALIDACLADDDIRTVTLTTEEEGIALAGGAWLGGQRCALLMQSSGVGNCINMLSLATTCRFPLALFVTMRGQWHEFNPWQCPMGETAERHLGLAGVQCLTASAPDDVAPMAAATLAQAFTTGGMAALLLHQRLMPVKTFGEGKAK
jgi:sulfopyruvate decarboxylase alpha subunit